MVRFMIALMPLKWLKDMQNVLILDNVPDLKTCKVNDCVFKPLTTSH